MKGVSDQIKCALQQSGVKTVFKPVPTLALIFKKPKDRPSEDRITGIVYKVNCKNCEFTYVEESKRCWASRSTEHDKQRPRSNFEMGGGGGAPLVTQYWGGGPQKHVFLLTLYNFKNIGGDVPPAPPPPPLLRDP